MKIVTLAERERKIGLVEGVTIAEETWTYGTNMRVLVQAIQENDTHLRPLNVDVLYFGYDCADEIHFLIYVDTLPHQLLSQSPHVVATQILVLEYELEVSCVTCLLVYLLLKVSLSIIFKEQHTLVNDTSPLFLRLKASAMGFGTDTYAKETFMSLIPYTRERSHLQLDPLRWILFWNKKQE